MKKLVLKNNPDMKEQERVVRFVFGLKETLRDSLLQRTFKTLDDAIEGAKRKEEAEKFKKSVIARMPLEKQL